jgi:hypothetical protein
MLYSLATSSAFITSQGAESFVGCCSKGFWYFYIYELLYSVVYRFATFLLQCLNPHWHTQPARTGSKEKSLAWKEFLLVVVQRNASNLQRYYFKCPCRLWVTSSLLNQGVPADLTQRREADHSFSSSAQFSNGWSCNFTPQHAFILAPLV